MPTRRARTIRFQPRGCSDAADGTNAPPGSLWELSNLVPDPSTAFAFVCRPAAFTKVNFATAGFSSPGFISSCLVVGNIAYGTIATARNSGKDEPYAVNLMTGTALTVNGITSANVPASPASSGAWTPPIVAQIGSRIVVTHPGFPGGTVKFGWFDVSGFTTSFTATTHSNTLLDGFTTNLGIQPGMTVSASNIPANTTVVSTTATSITISNPASTSASVTVTIAGGTPTNPLWGAGDTDRNNLPSVPVGVAQFYGRAYYALGINGLVYSDSGFACRVSNASGVQALLPNNGIPVTAVAPLMLSAPLVTTGIVQALIAFQGVAGMLQITGDQALSNLSMNALPMATGTAAPLSIAPCELGTAFLSPEGMRVIQFSGQVSDPIGDAGTGVTAPFIYSVVPSRMCAAANAHVIRCTAQNGYESTQPQQEWWWDIGRKIWTGPMTLTPSLIQPWQGANDENTFIVAPIGTAGVLMQSDPVPYTTSSYTELGAALQWTCQTSPLPDSGAMAMNALLDTTLAGAFDGNPATVTAAGISGVFLDTTSVPLSKLSSNTVWGSFVWGAATWGAGTTGFQQWPVYWHQPLVFKQLVLNLAGPSSGSLRLGNIYMRVEELGYPIPVPAGVA